MEAGKPPWRAGRTGRTVPEREVRLTARAACDGHAGIAGDRDFSATRAFAPVPDHELPIVIADDGAGHADEATVFRIEKSGGNMASFERRLGQTSGPRRRANPFPGDQAALGVPERIVGNPVIELARLVITLCGDDIYTHHRVRLPQLLRRLKLISIDLQRRQEFVLWSDSLGLSMLVDAVEHTLPEGATESTVLGPFYVPGAPRREYGASIAEEAAAGVPAFVHGRVLDVSGQPIADAELDVWQNGADRLYAVQRPEAPEDHLRGRFRSRTDGTYAFLAVRPVPYPIPYDGPVGAMLSATGRHPWRPAHIHMIVRAPGYRTLTTHVFDAASEYLGSDAVFAVKPRQPYLVKLFINDSQVFQPYSVFYNDFFQIMNGNVPFGTRID